MSKKKFTITQEDIAKMWRRVRRELDPKLPPAQVHQTHKKDKKRKNTVKRDDYD